MLNKKILIIILCLFSFDSFAQFVQPSLYEVFVECTSNLSADKIQKKTRGPLRLKKILGYEDSSALISVPGKVLSFVHTYSYKLNNIWPLKKEPTVYLANGIVSTGLAPKADTIEYLGAQGSTSNFQNFLLANYDSLGRLVVSADVQVSTIQGISYLDTTGMSTSTYSGSNLNFDTMIFFNSNLMPTSLHKNTVVNDLVVSADVYNVSSFPQKINTTTNTYNIAGKVVKREIVNINSPSSTNVQLFFYNTDGYIDSVSFYSYSSSGIIFNDQYKYSYDMNYTKSHWRKYINSNGLKTLTEHHNIKLDNNGYVTEVIQYDIVGIDSVAKLKSNFDYNSSGYLSRTYHSNYVNGVLNYKSDADSVIFIYNDFSLPIIEKEKVNCSIFPNPAIDAIFIAYESATSKNAKLTIVDFAGKIVATKDVELVNGNSILKMDISNLSKGNYLVKLITDKEAAEAIKFTKE